MVNLTEPYIIHYPRIVGVADENGDNVELIEFFDCIGGAMWSRQHYAKSPLVRTVRNVGSTMRYMLVPGHADLNLAGSAFPAGICGVSLEGREIAVSYLGLGGGGVGASSCRSFAGGVTRCQTDPSGGGRTAGSTIWIPRNQRVLIGVDDTDTPDEGATWTLAHNIARTIEDDESCYLSHTIVQLFPVEFRTKNCVSIVCEFATTNPDRLIGRFRSLLERYTLSGETGMAAYTGFDPRKLEEFAWNVKRGQVDPGVIESLEDTRLKLVMKGRGIVGAVAAIPFYTRYEEALLLCSGKS